MGPVPGAPGLHVLAGFSIFGIVYGGGAGRYAAEWIVDGQPSDDMWELDVRRFGEYARSTRYVAARACEVYEREYAIHYPEEELPAGRPLKTDPLYDRLLARGAVFGVRSAGSARSGSLATARSRATGTRSGAAAGTRRSGRSAAPSGTGVGVLDQTSFAKFEVSGPGAAAFLDRLCANTLPAETGRIALTQMCTQRAASNATSRSPASAEDRFYVVSAAATETHDLGLDRTAPPGRRLGQPRQRHEPLRRSYARRPAVARAPRRTRERRRLPRGVSRSSAAASSTSAWLPSASCGSRTSASSATSSTTRSSYSRHLYEQLRAAGEPLGLVDFGYRALESLRLEKAYRLWGPDLSQAYTPLEAGMERFVRFDKGDFIGREALLRAAGGRAWRDGSPASQSTRTAPTRTGTSRCSTASGRSATSRRAASATPSGTAIALAYLPVAQAEPGTALAVTILGERRPARVVAEPLYDPANERLLS